MQEASGEGGAESDCDSEEPPPKKRSAGPGTSQPRGAPSPSRPVSQQEPDRDALQARYEDILAMPDSRRTVAERAEVRQILTVQLLEDAGRSERRARRHLFVGGRLCRGPGPGSVLMVIRIL